MNTIGVDTKAYTAGRHRSQPTNVAYSLPAGVSFDERTFSHVVCACDIQADIDEPSQHDQFPYSRVNNIATERLLHLRCSAGSDVTFVQRSKNVHTPHFRHVLSPSEDLGPALPSTTDDIECGCTESSLHLYAKKLILKHYKRICLTYFAKTCTRNCVYTHKLYDERKQPVQCIADYAFGVCSQANKQRSDIVTVESALTPTSPLIVHAVLEVLHTHKTRANNRMGYLCFEAHATEIIKKIETTDVHKQIDIKCAILLQTGCERCKLLDRDEIYEKTANKRKRDDNERFAMLSRLSISAREKIETALIDYPYGYINILSDGSVYFSSRGSLYTGSHLAYEGDFHY
jgi:hypothetical protein